MRKRNEAMITTQKQEMTKMKSALITLSFAISLFMLEAASAKTLYVDSSAGNDAITYEQNSSSSPWASIGRAAWGSTSRSNPNANQAARSGDTVIVRSGTYSTAGTGERFAPAYNPVNSGTATAPIVFEAEGRVRLNLSSQVGPLIGAASRNYIVWRGFYINEATAPSTSDTGPVVLFSTQGSVIENCEIDGAGTANNRMDNHNGIRLESATNVIVRNNKIYNVTTGLGATHHNGGAIMSYFSTGALIENNEIYDSGSGIFVKGGDNRDFTIRYNLVRNNGKGIVTMYTSTAGQHNIYQNISRNNFTGVSIELNSHNINVVNNVLADNQNGLAFGSHAETISNIRIINNIVANATEGVSGGEAGSVTPFNLDYNIYYNVSSGWSINFNLYRTFSAWQSALGGTTNGDEYHSLVTNPSFTSISNGDYRLNSGSPAINRGLDVLDLNRNSSTSDPITIGAYITGEETIGYSETGVDNGGDTGGDDGGSAVPSIPTGFMQAN